MRFLTITSALTLITASVALTGCAGFQTGSGPVVSGPVTLTAAAFKGTAHGGQQPISGATVSLYQTGVSGYGMGSSIVPAVAGGNATTTSNPNGGFTIPAFTCTSGRELYVVASGGDPEGNGENNTAAILMEGLTSCDNQNGVNGTANQVTFVAVDEVTTVATIWALTPFMIGINVGTSSNNAAGLASAFGDIATLVNIETGLSPGTGLPSGTGSLPAGTTVPYGEINVIADGLATCVNSPNGIQSVANGGGTITSTGCSNLYTAVTPSGTTAPTDTVGAGLLIAKNPSYNPNGVIMLSAGIGSPYPTSVASANDLTIGISYTGAGSVTNPSAVAVDGSGNIWVTNNGATPSVTVMSHLGVPLSGSPFSTGLSLSSPSAIAIDMSGNGWVANSGNNTITEISNTGSLVGNYSGGGLLMPSSISFDGLGNAWLSNFGNNSASEFSSTGTAVSGASGYAATGVATPVGIAVNPH